MKLAEMGRIWALALLLLAGCARVAQPCEPPAGLEARQEARVPLLDHHQHLLSRGARDTTFAFMRSIGVTPQREDEPLIDADGLVRMLDEAGIGQALVLSDAYYFARVQAEQRGEYARVRAENDWTLAQIGRHPTRLFAACSVNPLRRYAAAEIERCAASGGFRALKLHFDSSGVDLDNPAHAASVRHAFTTANRLGLPIVAHLQSEAGFGGPQARTFLDAILPAAPDVPVTVNHLWGGGRYGPDAAAALQALAQAVQRRDPRTRNLWFDLAQVSMAAPDDADRAEIAARMRQIGFARLLYGSDGPEWNGVPPRQHWEEFKRCMPLSRRELDAIAGNVAPYLRGTRRAQPPSM